MLERKNVSEKRYKLMHKQRSLQAFQTLIMPKIVDKDQKPAEELIYGKIKLSKNKNLLNIQNKKAYEGYQNNDSTSRK